MPSTARDWIDEFGDGGDTNEAIVGEAGGDGWAPVVADAGLGQDAGRGGRHDLGASFAYFGFHSEIPAWWLKRAY